MAACYGRSDAGGCDAATCHVHEGAPTRYRHRMDNSSATLELLTPDELPHALRFIDVLERAGHMDAEEAGEWRWRIEV